VSNQSRSSSELRVQPEEQPFGQPETTIFLTIEIELPKSYPRWDNIARLWVLMNLTNIQFMLKGKHLQEVTRLIRHLRMITSRLQGRICATYTNWILRQLSTHSEWQG